MRILPLKHDYRKAAAKLEAKHPVRSEARKAQFPSAYYHLVREHPAAQRDRTGFGA
jgi:hypothetical protein